MVYHNKCQVIGLGHHFQMPKVHLYSSACLTKKILFFGFKPLKVKKGQTIIEP
jgi:hypothetical protein